MTSLSVNSSQLPFCRVHHIFSNSHIFKWWLQVSQSVSIAKKIWQDKESYRPTDLLWYIYVTGPHMSMFWPCYSVLIFIVWFPNLAHVSSPTIFLCYTYRRGAVFDVCVVHIYEILISKHLFYAVKENLSCQSVWYPER